MLNLCTTTTSHIQLKPYMVTRENVLAAANVSYRKGKSAAHVWTKALAAAERNDITTLNKLWGMPEGKFITRNFQGENGHILHYAAKRVKAKSVAWLLEHGADVNAVDREGETPLCWCATIAPFSRRTGVLLKFLIEAGANPNHQDTHGYTPLTHAVVRGAVDAVRRARVEMLLKLGANPCVRDREGKQPLDYLGMCTNDGQTWTNALPEDRKEMERCEVSLKAEIFRREMREIFWRERVRRQRTHDKSLWTDLEKWKSGSERTVLSEESRRSVRARGMQAEDRRRKDNPQVSNGLDVSLILVDMEDDEMFSKCLGFL